MAAIATSIIALSFISLGFVMSGYTDLSGQYLFIAGAALILISVFFTIGLFQLKNHNNKGRRWVILASFGLIATLTVSAIQILITSPGWKLSVLILLISVLAIAPFVWLINYLWRLQHSKKPS